MLKFNAVMYQNAFGSQVPLGLWSHLGDGSFDLRCKPCVSVCKEQLRPAIAAGP